MRIKALILSAAAIATAVAVSGCGSSDDKTTLSPQIEAALKYLPKDSAAVGLVPTDVSSGPIKQLADLGEQKVKDWDKVKSRIQDEISNDASQEEIDAILGNPLAFSVSGPDSDDTTMAIQVQNAATARKAADDGIAKGDAKALPEYNGAFLWQDTKSDDDDNDSDFNGLKGNVMFASDSEQLLKAAVDNSGGSDNASGNDDFKSKLEELGDSSLLRVVGDAQTAIANAEGDKAQAQKVKFVQAMGMFWSKSTVVADGIDSESVLETTNEDLGAGDVPFPATSASFTLPSEDTIAGLGIADPNHLIAFGESVAKQASPQGYDQYQVGLNQLKGAAGVDVHKDLLEQIDQISVALVGDEQYEFQAKLKDGQAFADAFSKAQTFIGGGLAGQGLTLTVQGSGENTTYVLKRSGGDAARFAIKGDSLVGSVGSRGDIPSPTAGSPIEGVSGALAFVVDYSNIAKLPSVRDEIDDPTVALLLDSLDTATTGITETTDRLTIKSSSTVGN